MDSNVLVNINAILLEFALNKIKFDLNIMINDFTFNIKYFELEMEGTNYRRIILPRNANFPFDDDFQVITFASDKITKIIMDKMIAFVNENPWLKKLIQDGLL